MKPEKPDIGDLWVALMSALGEFADVLPDFAHLGDEDFEGMSAEEAIELCRTVASEAEDGSEFKVHPDNTEEDARTAIDKLLSAAEALETALENLENDDDQPSE